MSKVAAFDMDLNGDGQPSKKKEELVAKFAGDEVILPVPSYNKEGNPTIVCKNLETVTSEEFLAWMKSVFPISKELAERFANLKGNGLETTKAKNAVFKAIVDLHENRWMFGKGPANLEPNN